jgi:polyphenol oxidase
MTLMPEIFHQDGEELLMLTEWQNVLAGFTTKQGGFSQQPFATFNLGLHVGDVQPAVVRNRQKLSELLQIPLARWICCEQTHDSHIAKITKQDAGKGAVDMETALAQTDGLYTNEAELLLALCFADCVPLYFAAPNYGLVGVAHAGWKGTVKNIAGKMVRLWCEREHIPLQEIMVAIGPAIGSCCYIVDDRVLNAAQNALGEKRDLPYREVSLGQYALDLKELNRLLLIKEGVLASNIQVSDYCTSCAEDLFFSHRRDNGQTGRMMAFIVRKEE